MDEDGVLLPWVNLEIIGSGSDLAGAGGLPGNLRWTYDGEILIHVFVPVGSEDEEATRLALAAGEVFRAKKFYDAVPGYYVRTLTPSIDDGDSGDDDGNWFRCTMSCDFTYWHRG